MMCAGFILQKYATEYDLSSLKWLTIEQMHKVKQTFKSLNDNDFPQYTKPSLHTVLAYNLSSGEAPVI